MEKIKMILVFFSFKHVNIIIGGTESNAIF